MGISFEMPVGHHFLTGLEIPFYARWASLFDRLCLLIRIGQTGLEIPFYARWASLLKRPNWPKKKAIRLKIPFHARLCLALLGFGNFLPMPVGHLF